jgi:hypothetical protein
MKTKEEREKELRALLQTQEGLAEVMELYHATFDSGDRPASLGRIGLLACQMIPRIVEAEFRTKVPVA